GASALATAAVDDDAATAAVDEDVEEIVEIAPESDVVVELVE
ncbi:hypothetical protein L195_g062279, partial [Trifolium pratense]